MKTPSTTSPLCCKDVLTSVFELNTLDYQVFQHLRKNGAQRADHIAEHLHKERSTIYRSLQKLCSCGLCKKSTHTLPGGGYYHMYNCPKTQKVKQELEHCIDAWYQQVKETLKRFDEDFS